MFRNLTFFRFPPIDRLVLLHLNEHMGLHAAKPVGPMELSSRGWVSVLASDTNSIEDLVRYVGDAALIRLGGEDKLLPSSAVNAELAKRLKAMEETEGRKLGGRARKRLKDEVVQDLLPRALVKPYRLDGYLDLKRGLVVVDTASRKAAEEFVSQLRLTLGSFPALPLNAEVAPRQVLTHWLAEGLHTGGSWVLGDECELRDAADHGAVARLAGQDLHGDEVHKHMEAGKQCTRLGLCDGDRLSFTLGEDLVVRKLKFLDGAMEALETEEREDLQAELDARATLLVGEVGGLFDTLERAFKLSKVEG